MSEAVDAWTVDTETGTATEHYENSGVELKSNLDGSGTAYTSGSGESYYVNDNSGWGKTYTGEGLGFDDFYSDVHNASFGVDIPVVNLVIDKEYLNVSGGTTIGDFVNDYNGDNFGDSSNTTTISGAISDLNDINVEVEREAYFYHDDASKKEELNTIIANLETLLSGKTSMSSDTMNSAGSAYNDDLEIAKNLQYNRYLESKADAYNANPKKLSDSVYVEEYRSTGFTYDMDGEPHEEFNWVPKEGWMGPIEENTYFTVEKETLTEQSPTYGVLNNYKAEPGYEKTNGNTRVTVTDSTYDYIKYYAGWKEWNTIFDLKYTKESLMEKLTGRGVEYSPLTERQSNHYFSEGK